MKNIEILARQFRKALDMAYDDNMFTNMYPFNHFPKDCCEHTCDLLANTYLNME